MRWVFLVLALLAFIGCSPKAEKTQYTGQVIFILAPDGVSDPHESSEVESDFDYLVENVSPYFEKHRIKYEVQRSRQNTLTALDGVSIDVKGEALPPVGYILIKPTGKFVVRNGLGTDVDVITDVANFFKIRQD